MLKIHTFMTSLQGCW